jgi:glycosyltransferase involved in cell wall biosynthesis
MGRVIFLVFGQVFAPSLAYLGQVMSEPKPRMFVLTTTRLAIHFFFKPHLKELDKYFDITLAFNPNLDDYLAPLGLPVREFSVPLERKISPWNDLLALIKLTRFFWSERFDIVVTVVPKAGLLGMLAAWLTRVPLRVHIFQGEVWASRQGSLRWLLKAIDGLTARLATHVLAVSASELAFLEKEGVVPFGKAKVLGSGSICGVDTERFKLDPIARVRVRRMLEIPELAIVCVFLGRLTFDKGLVELVKAFDLSASTQADLWLLLAGPDEEKMQIRLRELVPEVVNQRMLFSGFTQSPEQILAASDFLCLPSHREGFGMVIIEAAAVGVPAIGTRIHGITDAIEDRQTGLLVPIGDVGALAEAITLWSESPQIIELYSKAARERVISKFEQQKIVANYVEYFLELFPGKVQ